MNDLNEALKKLLETPKQGRAQGLSEALGNALRQTGQPRPTTDLGSIFAAALKKGAEKDAPLPPIPGPATIAKLDGASANE